MAFEMTAGPIQFMDEDLFCKVSTATGYPFSHASERYRHLALVNEVYHIDGGLKYAIPVKMHSVVDEDRVASLLQQAESFKDNWVRISEEGFPPEGTAWKFKLDFVTDLERDYQISKSLGCDLWDYFFHDPNVRFARAGNTLAVPTAGRSRTHRSVLRHIATYHFRCYQRTKHLRTRSRSPSFNSDDGNFGEDRSRSPRRSSLTISLDD